ncbi:MAG: ATP synthase F0 subunit B [Desulfobacterales bacterium]|nr:ATP synthase F0 subunit B [Desulfobacterales bacterium]
MQIVSNVALISINSTLFIQLLSFLIFLYIINKIMFKPLEGTMQERIVYIEGLKNDIIDAKENLQTLIDAFKQKEDEAKDKSFLLKDERIDQGKAKASEIFSSFKNEIDALKQDAENQVSKQISDAKKEIEAEAEDIAVEIMTKILGRSLKA